MKFYVKLLAIVLVLVTFSTQVASCAFPSFNIGTTDKNTSTDNVVVIPPNSGENGENSGNHVGGAVVENVTAPYIADVYVSAPVEPDESNRVPEGGVNLDSSLANAIVPGGVKLEDGSNEIALTINGIEDSKANVELLESEVSSSFDVHVSGVALDNIVPMEVKLTAAAVKGLNSTSIKLYHVENGETIEMTLIPNDAEFTAHNQFKYDPATGDVTLYIASFSEFAIVANTDNAWTGGVDHSWYEADATELVIANAEQLWSLSQIVGGMNGQTPDSFAGKTITLIADINLGDKESENNPDIIFYPIGYYNSEGTYERTNTAITSGLRNFEGTFDGNGHTIANFYQNTWEMKGDHNWYSPEEQYYRDGMGLFGRVYGGTVKNLTVENFSSDGEITTTGVIAAYADGATFQNISIFNCNPRVYNIGNGGIVGCVGWYAKEAGLKTYFTNITVDNTNKISALWGSYDVACGGIVGQYYPTSGQSSAGYPVNAGIEFTNCHVSAIMDVYNDVCANYQYYAYRYTGMLIGSVRENETIYGRVYPKMDGIEANGCTVHFGTWNDYYYCELVANTTASYTHDHQMSRLEQVLSVEGTTITPLKGEPFTVPAEGRYNYVVVTGEHASENATCYHFVDGAVWNHEDAGYHNGENGEKFIDENGDGEPDLKEDKQHIYLEFNNLFTGYGWGVTSKGLEDFEGVGNIDIEAGRETSVEKFTGVTGYKPLTGSSVTVGELFTAITGGEVEVLNDNVVIAVHSTNTVGATLNRDKDDWKNSTLTFWGVGELKITITDYYFCKPTTVTVDVQPVDKFTSKFTNTNFTYRVGNQNAIALGSLFGTLSNLNVPVDSANVEISVSGTTNYIFTPNTSDWTKATLKFEEYVGVVTITITDETSKPCSVTVEVINAVNATGASSAKNNNVVLLNDCGFSSLEVSGGYTLFGNGFTMTCASDSYAADLGYSFVTLSNGTLDNVQIVCPNFDYAALYKSNLTSSDNRSYVASESKTYYYNARSAIMVNGNSQILNSRISGGRAAVNITGGNVVIDNSRIELGAVASLLIGPANSVILRDVTLVQKPTESTYKVKDETTGTETGTTIMGLSVLYLCDANGSAAPTTLEGTLVQYAWANANSSQYAPEGTDTIISTVLAKAEYTHTINDTTCVNLGFAYMPSDTATIKEPTNITDNRTDASTVPYYMEKVNAKITITGVGTTSITTYVYTYKNTNGTNVSFQTEGTYTSNKYSDIVTVNYDDTTEGLTTGKSYGTNGWIYELNVDLDTASGYALDFSKLSMTVNGTTASNYLVNGSAKPTSPITVVAGGVTYTLTATIDGKEYTATLKVIGTETSKEAPSAVAKDYGSILLVGEKGTSTTWSLAAPALEGIQIKYWSVAEKQYKTISLSDYTPTSTGQQNGSNPSWAYTADNNDFTLTITNTAAVHSSNGIYAMPVVVNNSGNKLYFVITSSNGLVSTSSGTRNITLKYVFEDNNGGRLEFTNTFSASYDSSAKLYDYSEFAGGTLKEASGACVTGDTLITLADGTQKRIDAVTTDDMLLVWNHFTGNYEAVPAAIIFNHGFDNNTVIKLNFSDGTQVKMVNLHQFFDADLNKYVSIDATTVADYVGHNFVKQSGDSYTTVTLDSFEISEEYIEAYGIISALHYNILVEGMFSTDFMLEDYDLFNYFAFGEGMMFDAELMQNDIEKYGLYTYEDFADYLTYEQFVAFNVQYFKISVAKGHYTYEGILDLISEYLNK